MGGYVDMQIEKLKKYYQDALVQSAKPDQEQDYYWFLTDANEKFGILKSILTEKEQQLLSLLFTSCDEKKMEMNSEQEIWYNFLYGNDSLLLNIETNIRFIYFYIKTGQFDYHDFGDAVKALFPTTITIIWKNDHEGIVIEKEDEISSEMVYFEEIVDTLSSDFYLNLYLLIGQKIDSSTNLREQFLWEESVFHNGLHMIQTKKIFKVQDVLPYLFLEEISPHTKKHAMASILHTTIDDQELINTIKVFIECNLNVSSAAKKLYMHRNSLQYRIDKFIEKTGVDIKNFNEAMIAYLIILNFESL